MLLQMGGPALGSRQDHSALASSCSSSQDHCIQAQVLFKMVAGMVLVPVVSVADGAEALWTPAVFTRLTTFTFLTFSRELLPCLVYSLTGGATSLGCSFSVYSERVCLWYCCWAPLPPSKALLETPGGARFLLELVRNISSSNLVFAAFHS